VFTADGSSVLTTTWDKAKIWDYSTGKCKKTLSRHSAVVKQMLFGDAGCTQMAAVPSADGSSVLTASDDKNATICDRVTGKCKQTLSGHTGMVTSASFSTDCYTVLTASEDRTAKMWDCSTGKCMQTLSGHTGVVRSVVFLAGA